MQIPLTKIFLILMFIFALFSNIFNYVAIGTTEWLTAVNTNTNPAVQLFKSGLWKLEITTYALIATGTALNILSLIFAVLSLLSLCVAKIRDSFAVFFVFGCLITSLLALLFNTTGWYFVNVNNVQPITARFSFGWSYWLMTPSFGCNVLAAVFASCIIGCSFALNKFENRQKNNQGSISGQTYQISNKPSSTLNNEGYYSTEVTKPGTVQATTYTYQNESYQTEQRVLRL